MVEMPRDLPRYVYAERSRHGRLVFYFRRGKGKRVRLPAPDDGEFHQAYADAIAGSGPAPAPRPHRHTLAWLIEQYRQSSSYLGLSRATRRQRDNIFKHVKRDAGGVDFTSIERQHMVEGRERRAATPSQARNFLDAMRGLFAWAVEAQHLADNPTDGVRNPPRPKTKGFEIWTDQELAAYRQHWRLGTRERVWLEVLIGTGARRGDAVVIGRQHLKGNMLAIETQKESVWAYVPILPEMTQAIEAGPTGDLHFIVGKSGNPLTKESFGNMFGKACRAAGVQKSAHGLRKYAATAFAEQGLSEAELESIFGWVRGSAMAAHYSKNAARKRIAEAAAEKIVNTNRPHLSGRSPHLKKDVG